ncbi:MAG: hypothetical protein ACREPI_03075 [Candidatus Dormibacterales bacterium]
MPLGYPWLLFAVAAGVGGSASLTLFLFECTRLLRDDWRHITSRSSPAHPPV